MKKVLLPQDVPRMLLRPRAQILNLPAKTNGELHCTAESPSQWVGRRAACGVALCEHSKCNHTPYRAFVMIPGVRAARLTHMGGASNSSRERSCSNRQGASREENSRVCGERW